MSRAFHPPDFLSKEDNRTIADVRREIWKNGMIGLLFGSAFGFGLHTTARMFYARLSDGAKKKLHFPGSDTPLKFSRNTAFLSVMASGAFGSYVCAITAGKNNVHNLHPIYEVGKNVNGGTPYQQALARSRAKEEETHERVKRRLSRRALIRQRLEEGEALSNSHGDQWITNDSENNDEH